MAQLAQKTDLPLYHASGFSHPVTLIYTHRSYHWPEIARWGLVPHWVQDLSQAADLAQKTLNARVETLTEKPSFKTAVLEGRGVLYLDGFYEHQHRLGKAYPNYIQPLNDRPLAVAVLFNDRHLPNSPNYPTFTIVTTKGKAHGRDT